MYGENEQGAPYLCYPHKDFTFSNELAVEANVSNPITNKPVIASKNEGPLFIDLKNDGLLDECRIGWGSAVTAISNSVGGKLAQTRTQLELSETGEPPIAQLLDHNSYGYLDFFT